MYRTAMSDPLWFCEKLDVTKTVDDHGKRVITDADSSVQEVRGEGVVGEQPLIPPGKSFRYTSGATLTTPVGCMEGSYTMVRRDTDEQASSANGHFEVPIPAFSLHTPTALH